MQDPDIVRFMAKMRKHKDFCLIDLMSSHVRQIKGIYYKSCVLERIYVDPKHRNQGIGKSVIKDLIVFADTNDFLILLTDSTAYGSDPVRLRKFYLDHEFMSAKDFGITQYTLCRLPIIKQP